MALPDAFLDRLRTELPSDGCSLDPTDLAEYGRDWTRVHPPAPSAIAFPRSTSEVSAVVRACAEHGVPLVPSGGRTGLAGGALAARGELVLSLTRMRRMDPVDLLGATVRVEAGAVTEAVHAHCAEHGLTWPVDFASTGSSHMRKAPQCMPMEWREPTSAWMRAASPGSTCWLPMNHLGS